MNEIILCGRPNACCPKIKKAGNTENEYVIMDDYGGEVYLTKEQFCELCRADLSDLDE